MKTDIFVAALLALFVGCAPQQQSDQLTQQQKDQIKSEVKAAADSFFAKVERLDANGALQYVGDSSNFVSYNSDGSHIDFQTLKKASTETFASAISFKATIQKEDFRVVTKDFVVYSRVQRAEVLLKSGDKLTSDPDAMTYLFRKIDGQWKLVYTHESETLVTQKAGKK